MFFYNIIIFKVIIKLDTSDSCKFLINKICIILNNMRRMFGFLLLILTVTCSGGQSLGFNRTMAEIAVGYATCPNVQTASKSLVENWTYYKCTRFQASQNVESIKLVTYDKTNLLALSLYDKENNLNVLSFRASISGQDQANARVDANIFFKKYTEWGLKKSQVHSGFYKSYNHLKEQVRQNANKLIQRNPNAKFLVTGISLGGALAALASFDLVNYFKEKKVVWAFYTFGQPRIGNQRFIDEINKQITIYRVVNQDDPVPHMPSRKGLLTKKYNQYYNPGIQVYLPTGTGTEFTAQICSGDSNHCSLNRNTNMTLVSACNHIGYPHVNFTKVTKITVNTAYNGNLISRQDQNTEYNTIFNFLKSCCHAICDKEGQIPECLKPKHPQQLKYLQSPPGQDQLIQIVLLHSGRNKIYLQKGKKVIGYVCKQVCKVILSSKFADSNPSAKELQDERKDLQGDDEPSAQDLQDERKELQGDDEPSAQDLQEERKELQGDDDSEQL